MKPSRPRYRKPSPADLRKANRAEILRLVYFDGPLTRWQISKQTGISPATVTHIAAELLAGSLLVEAGRQPTASGRPGTLLQINPGFGFFIGIEAGETFVDMRLFNTVFTPLQAEWIPLAPGALEPARLNEILAAGMERLIQKAGLEQAHILGAGIGFPGLVDPARGVSIFASNWGWQDVPVTHLLKERFAFPLFVENGAKAMALAEMLFGAGQGMQDIAVLLVGTGVGAGVISGGKLLRGYANHAGEFGHTTIDINGPACRCGGRGCLEMFVGANAILKRYQQYTAQPRQAHTGQMAALQHIFSAYEQEEPAARQMLDEAVRCLGAGMANLINATNPQILLLGGWLGSMLAEKFLPQIQAAAAQYALPQSLAQTRFGLCRLGEGAVATGAATLVLQYFFETAGEPRHNPPG